MAIRKRIFDLLEEKKLNISDLCSRINVSPSTLYDLEKNRTKVLKVSTVKQSCFGFGITMAEFFSPDYFNDEE